MINIFESASLRPYLIRALYEWCVDSGLTPYVAVQVDETVQVPREYVKNNEIVLNISSDATSALKLGNEFIEFKARFAGSAREVLIPIVRVAAIYARESGEGVAFPPLARSEPSAGPMREAEPLKAHDSPAMQLVTNEGVATEDSAGAAVHEDGGVPRPPTGGGARPSLKRIK